MDRLRARPIDLHVHLRGTINPAAARLIAERNRLTLPSDIFDEDHTKYAWSSFTEFLQTYDKVGSVICNTADLEWIAETYLLESAREGVLYVEFMLSPFHLMAAGIPYKDQLAAVSAASDRAREASGIECRLIPTCVRHHGPEIAFEVAELVANHRHPIVVGFGMTGDERQYNASDFVHAFRLAKDAGLKLTAHAGEFRGAESVEESVKKLHLNRVGHGVRSVENPRVIEMLQSSGVGLEICISSNVALGLYPSAEEHPFEQLRKAGCLVTLATDDPAYFATSPKNEYLIAATAFGLSAVDCKQITLSAIDAAFCDNETKARLRQSLEGNNTGCNEKVTAA
jgi:adenosine deaminase